MPQGKAHGQEDVQKEVPCLTVLELQEVRQREPDSAVISFFIMLFLE
jgi:hypothetical protein